jgi:hypothetical protein
MNSIDYCLKQSTRFFPHWNQPCGSQVSGLIELVSTALEKNHNNQTWCEIGSNIGESALIISSFLQIEKLYCIDFFWDGEIQYNEFKKRTRINSSKIELLKYRSDEVYHLFENASLDGIYIDGNHSYEFVKNDLDFAFRAIKINGFICGHDYGDAHKETKQAVNEFISKNNLTIYKLFKDSSFMIEKTHD